MGSGRPLRSLPVLRLTLPLPLLRLDLPTAPEGFRGPRTLRATRFTSSRRRKKVSLPTGRLKEEERERQGRITRRRGWTTRMWWLLRL